MEHAKKLLMIFGIISLIFGLYMLMTVGMTNPPSSPVFNAGIITIIGGIMIAVAWKIKK